MHRLPWWLKDAGEVTWPVHDPPVVWNRWPGLAGLPLKEVMPGVPIHPGCLEGIPFTTLHVRASIEGEQG